MSGVCRRLKEKLVSIYKKLFVVRFKVAVLGLEGCGKSVVVQNIFEGGLRHVGRQKDAEVYECSEDNVDYVIYDVSGKRASRTKWDYFYRKCDVLLYCVDTCGSKKRWEKAREELRSLVYRNVWTKKNMLVLGTKNDMEESRSCKEIILNLDLMGIRDREVSCFSISAKSNRNMECIKPWIVDQCNFLKRRQGLRMFGG